MKTLKNKLRGIFFLSAMLFVLLINIKCNKEDDVNTPPKENKINYKITGVNQCSTAVGIGTSFNISIHYKPLGGTVNNIFFTQTSVSDGVWESAFHGFTNNKNIITFKDCFRFEANTWVDYEVIINSSDGSKSSPFYIRVNKPPGAN